MPPSPPSDLTLTLLSDLTTQGDALKSGSPGAREALLTTAQRLIASLQHPTENALQLLWAQPTHLSIVRLGVEMHLFAAMHDTPPAGDPSAIIAARCVPRGTVDPVLVARMLRHLAAMGTVTETSADTFAPTPTSRAYAQDKYRDTILYIVDDYQPALDVVPAFFKANGFQIPTSSTQAPFQAAFKEEVHYFEYFDRCDREMGRRFASMMDVWSEGRERWFGADYYPIEERLIAGAEPEGVFLVDVGGGTGACLSV